MIHQIWLLGVLLAATVAPSLLGGQPLSKAPPERFVALAAPAPLPVKQASAVQPVVGAKSALVIDLPSNQTLFAQDADTERPIASLSKLLTALLVAERTSGDETVTVPTGLPGSGLDESRMGLRPGDQLKVSDLMAGMLVASANDAANLLARQVAGSEAAFVKLMRERASQLGLKKARFENPSGYGQGENTGTAREMAVLARAAIAEPKIQSVVGIKELVVTPLQGDPYPIKNTDELLGGYLPIAGLKTGTSDAAGPCLISQLAAAERQLLAVVLNSPNRFQENKAMLDWSLRSYRW